jgi:competence protein ComEC
MLSNDDLKLHFVNVNHGDATIIEFPDHGEPDTASFAVVDFGAKKAVDRGLTRDYLQALIDLRRDGTDPFDYRIEFVCATHPHDDHYGGLKRFMQHFGTAGQDKVRDFWDCGFRTNSIDYNDVLDEVIQNDRITFVRLGSGSEFEFDETRITVLAPSVDLRNRFDTFGVGKNDASIVLRVKFRNSYAILAADAEYASWGKITEEFPRTQTIDFFEDALGLSEREDTADQLKCNLLKMAHHGSKHGTSLEYLERLKPRHVVIPAGSQAWYGANLSNWANKFPHELVTKTLEVLDPTIETHVTGVKGNLIFKYGGGFSPGQPAEFMDRPGTAGFAAALAVHWA